MTKPELIDKGFLLCAFDISQHVHIKEYIIGLVKWDENIEIKRYIRDGFVKVFFPVYIEMENEEIIEDREPEDEDDVLQPFSDENIEAGEEDMPNSITLEKWDNDVLSDGHFVIISWNKVRATFFPNDRVMRTYMQRDVCEYSVDDMVFHDVTEGQDPDNLNNLSKEFIHRLQCANLLKHKKVIFAN